MSDAPKKGTRADDEARPKPGMFDWYSPTGIAHSAVKVVASGILGDMVDMRRVGALEGSETPATLKEGDAEGGAFSFDYVADTGDGWDATFTMACVLSAKELTPEGAKDALPRGGFLLLGGDQVYPDASRQSYAQRLVWPFNAACRRLFGDPEGDKSSCSSAALVTPVYLIPGNHDWYDSLASFTHRFLQGRRLGSFLTRQTRSYFAIELPMGWELWGLDLQLQHGLDVQQRNFFKARAKALKEGQRVIVCTAEPTFVYGSEPDEELRFQLGLVEASIARAGARVPLILAGDIHNYQRYERTESPGVVHEVVCGGGGAFLHPTHVARRPRRGLKPKHERTPKAHSPSSLRSFLLSLRLLLFPIEHRLFALLLGVVYALLGVGLGDEGVSWSFALDHPARALLAGVVVLGGLAFSRKEAEWWGAVVGVLHGVTHVAAALFACRVLAPLASGWHPFTGVAAEHAELVLTVVVAGLTGGFVFGLFLFVALVLGIHHNEAFSALSWPHDKSFLRCRLVGDELEVTALAVPRTGAMKSQHPMPTRIIETFRVK